jgi:hypothetical protein|tara:strand:- start:80 stop:310 length:231 start_codon:yes stop_codon:yes gene_type:complete
MFKKLLERFNKPRPVQLSLNFGSDIKFKDCIRKISSKHGSRGSVLQSVLTSHVSDKEYDRDQWKIDEMIKNYHKDA